MWGKGEFKIEFMLRYNLTENSAALDFYLYGFFTCEFNKEFFFILLTIGITK